MPSCHRLAAEGTAYGRHLVQLRAWPCPCSGTGLRTASWLMTRQPFCVRLHRPTRGRVAAFVAGWSLRSEDLLRVWSLGEQPRVKCGYWRSTLPAPQPAEGRRWFSGDQGPGGDGS